MNTQEWVRKIVHRRTLPHLRFLVSAGFALVCFYSGYRFYLFYLWAVGKSAVYVPRPPAVEGFLPISALMGLKRFILTGEFDMIHPAGMVIFMVALLIALFLRKGFCGWICPVGFSSNLAERLGKKIGIHCRLPGWLDLPLLSVKYILLGFFGWVILWRMGVGDIEAFMDSPYNLAVDAKMLLFFLEPSRLAGGIMIGLVVISFFLTNFWCRYLCPYGGLLGLLALASPIQVKRDPERCIACKKCEKICPASIKVTHRQTVRNCECIGCLECVAVCPVESCLTVATPGRRHISPVLLPAAVVLLFCSAWLLALYFGYWQTIIPPDVFQQFYRNAGQLAHP